MSTPSKRTGAATKAEGPHVGSGRPEPSASDRPSLRAGGPQSLVGIILGGRYFMERLIGEGGMGAVYEAEHTHMRKRLAVKVLHPEMGRLPEVVARFEREAMAAAHIEHPNVAAATDFGKLDDGSFFLVLEYVEGKGLRENIADGRLELGRVLHIVRQIASALARAHSLGIVHRDLKPENVMLVTREGDPDFVKVLDFGIAKVPVGELVGENKASGQVLTQMGMVYGTPEYMAPEQALGQEVDSRADLYSLGVMTFEMITGARPFEHESKVTLLGMHVTAPIPRMGDRAPDAKVPPEVDAIVGRLLAKEAGARFGDAKELIEALDATALALAAAGRISEPMSPMSRLTGARPSVVALGEASVARSAIGSAPTSLAQLPATTGPGLASLVGASVGNVLKSAPPWVTPRIAIVGACALLFALVGTVLFAVSSGHGVAAPSGSSSASAGASGTADAPPAPGRPESRRRRGGRRSEDRSRRLCDGHR